MRIRPAKLERIFEGRLACRRVILENASDSSLIDHPVNE